MSAQREPREEKSGAKRPFFRRRKSGPFSGPNAPEIDGKNVRLLSRYISERGKIIPSRITAVSQKKQRELAIAIKQARFMGLMPYVRTENEPRPYTPRDRGGDDSRGGYGSREGRGEFNREPRGERSFSKEG